MKRARRGFTLIEVICVLTIIAIIAAIAVPNISGYIKKSKVRNCENVMTNFVNDLEYRIVSKRFYDINELNMDMISVVNSYAEDFLSESGTNEGSTFSYLTEKINDASGICPNGGKYIVEWKITPGAEEINSAKVDVVKCECDCMGAESHIVGKTHNYTAALVASGEYIESDLPLEVILRQIIDRTVRNIEGSEDHVNPAEVENLLGRFSDPTYRIAGLTMNGSKVEWISMYYQSNFDARNESENNYKFFTLSVPEDRFEIADRDNSAYSDISSWPPAEGSEGAYVFKENWKSGTTDLKHQVAQLNDAVPGGSGISWIQRDGAWYVEKNIAVKGIDLTDAEAEGHPLTSPDNNNKPDAHKVLGITPAQNADFSNLKNSLKITAKYENNKEVKFGHLGVSDSFFSESPDEYTVRNGYIIVSSEDAADINWAGIFKKDSGQSDKAALKGLLENENSLINDFKSGIESGETRTLTIAYQEYFKSYNSAAGEYTYEPVTVFGTVTGGNSYIADDSRKMLVDNDNETLKVPVKFPLTVNGSESTEIDIPAYLELPLFGEDKPLSGETDVLLKDEAVAVIEVVENAYDIVYKQPESADGKFRVEDISVGKKLTYIIKDKKTGEEIGRIEEKAEIKHCSEGGSEGFYISDWNNPANESQWVDNINAGRGGASIFVTGVDTPICGIGDVNPTYSWSYDKKSDDTDFSPENINLKIFYEIELYPVSGYTASAEGKVVCEMKHKTTASADEDGFYIAEDNVTDPSKENDTLEKINGHTSVAYLKVYRDSDREFNNKTIGVVKTELTGIDAEYDNKADSEFSFENLTAKAKYTITVYDNVNTSDIKAVINHEETLNHDADPDAEYRYFVSKTKSTNISYVRNNEKSAISELNKAQEGYYYVVYSDVTTLCKDIYVNVKAGINPSEIVYIPDGNNTAHMIAYLGAGNVLNIPSSHEGYWSLSEPEGDEKYIKVEAGSQGVYYYIDDEQTYSITRIGDNPAVFPQNSQSESKVKMPPHTIKTVSIEDGVREIGPYAFQGLWMEDGGSISIPDSIETIGIGAFENCGGNNLKKITLGTFSVSGDDYKSSSKLTTIGASAFQNCNSLEENDVFIIPESVKSIGNDAFTEFRMSNGTFVINGVSEYAVPKEYSRSSTPDGANTVHAADTNGAEGTITNKPFGRLTVNSLVIGGNVERIDDEAFVQKIGDNFNSTLHFNNNATSRLVIGGSVKTVGAYAFAGANFDDELVFGDSVTNIGTGAFENCVTYTGTLDLNRITDIGGYAFSGMIKATGGLEIPRYINNIAGHAFRNFAASTDAEALKLYAGTVNGIEVGGWVFDGANFDGITVAGDKITKISDYAFNNEASIETGNKLPYNNIRGELEITATGITSVGVSAFRNCTGLTGSVIIPYTVNTVDDYAFYGCKNLDGKVVFDTKKVDDKKLGTERIGIGAFCGCTGLYKNAGLTAEELNLTIPSTVKYIGRCAFKLFGDSNTAKSLTILGGSSGDVLGKWDKDSNDNPEHDHPIFPGSKFVNLTIGGSVREIYAGFLDNTIVELYNSNLKKAFDDGLIDETEYNRQKKINDETYGYSEITGTLTFEEDCNVNIINENAFRGSSFSGSLVFPESLSIIKSEAFSECKNFSGSLDTRNVTAIGPKAFYKCNGFNGTLSIDKVNKIGTGAFEECEKFHGDLTIPSSTVEIEKHAFYNFGGASKEEPGNLIIKGGSLKNSDGTVEITSMIFSHSRFNNIIIGGEDSTITKIGSMAFQNVDYDNVISPYKNITGSLIIKPAWKNKNGETVCVTEIGASAFMNCAFTGKLELSGVQTIGAGAFSGCTELYTEYVPETAEERKLGQGILKIPSSVTSIGADAFKSVCSSINNSDKYPKLIVNGISSTEYNTTTKKNVGVIDSGRFNDSKFRNVEFGGNVNKIAKNAFQWYKQLRGNIVFRDNVDEIGDNAFQECGFDGELKLGNVSTIKSSAFHKCYSLYSTVENGKLEIPESMNRIVNYAFGEVCKQTPELNKPELIIKGGSVNNGTKLEGPIFNEAHFKNVTIGGKITEIADGAFNNTGNDKPYYGNLKGNLVIEDSVITIGDNAFKGCSGFDGHLTLGSNSDETKGLQKIGESAFEGCTAFSSVYSENSKRKIELNIPASVKKIGAKAFESFGLNASDSGWLVADGYSSGDTVRTTVDGTDHNVKMLEANLFNHARFEGVSVGWNVTGLAEGFMKHGGDYDYSNISGDLYIGYNVYYIGKEAFSAENLPEGKGFNGTISFGYGESVGKEICEKAFFKQKFTGNLVFPYTVSCIDKEAFAICEKLNGKIVFNSQMPANSQQGIKKIGEAAFSGCSAVYTSSALASDERNFTIPETVTNLGFNAFYKLGYENSNPELYPSYTVLGGTLKNGRNVLEKEIFKYAKIRNLTIGGKVQDIADNFMDNYTKDWMYKSETDPENTGSDYMSTNRIEKVRYDEIKGSLTIGNSVETIGKNAFWNCSGFDRELIISKDNPRLRTIGESAFAGCTGFSYTKTTSDHSIVNNYYTTYQLDYDGLVIPNTVTEIGSFAFKEFSKSGDSAGYLWMHAGSADNGKTIEPLVFTGSKFDGIYIGDKITKIADKAFYTYSEDTAGYKYKNWDLDQNNANYLDWKGDILIDSDNSSSSKGVKDIGNHAFFNCNQMNGLLYFVPGVQTIGENAFNRFYSATRNLVIPMSVKSIGRYAFKGYASETAPESRGRLEIYGGSCENGHTLGTVDSSGGTEPIFPHSNFNSVCIGGNVTKISANTFKNDQSRNSSTNFSYDYSGFKGDLLISGSVSEIGASAFQDCDQFDKRLVFNSYFRYNGGEDDHSQNSTSSGVHTIGASAFAGCTNFYSSYTTSDGKQAEFEIPDSVKEIGADAFESMCSGILESNFEKVPKLKILGSSTDNAVTYNRTQYRGVTSGVFTNSKFNGVTFGGECKVITSNAFSGYTGWTGILDITSEVKAIYSGCFNPNSFSQIRISNQTTNSFNWLNFGWTNSEKRDMFGTTNVTAY